MKNVFQLKGREYLNLGVNSKYWYEKKIVGHWSFMYRLKDKLFFVSNFDDT